MASILVAFAGIACEETLAQGADATSSSTTGGGGLVCRASSYDFGTIGAREASKCVHRFRLQNVSEHAITLQEKSVGTCGCISLDLPRDAIKPGKTVDVVVGIDWSSRSEKQEERLLLKTDDPTTPELMLVVKGFVRRQVVLSTHSLDLGRLRPTQKATKRVSLSQGMDRRPFRIVRVEIPDAHFTIARTNQAREEDRNLPLAGGPGMFTVTFSAPEKRGEYEGTVVFHTDAEDEPRFVVQVRGSSSGGFTVTPEMLCLSGSVSDRRVEASLRIDASGYRRVTAVEVASSGDNRPCPFHIATVACQTANDASQTTIAVAFVPAQAEAVVSQGVLTVRLEGEVLTIPMVATRLPGRTSAGGR